MIKAVYDLLSSSMWNRLECEELRNHLKEYYNSPEKKVIEEKFWWIRIGIDKVLGIAIKKSCSES